MIYLDNAATSFLKPSTVLRAVESAMRTCASPGRGGHQAAMEASKRVFSCRTLAGELFSCLPEQVIFTMNATHGLNMAIQTLVPRGGRVVVSGFEHNAVMRPLHALGAACTVAGRKLFDPEDTLRAFDAALRERTDCVICTHVSNVFGYVLPVYEIAALCRRRGVPFILDASQSAGCLEVSAEKLGAAFIAMPGHKGLYGPQGTGLLLCAQLPRPILYGGTGSLSREYSMPDFLPDAAEAGTPNVTGICGLEAGLRFVAEKGCNRILEHERKLCRTLRQELMRLPHLQIYAGDGDTQTGVLSVSHPSMDCEEMAEHLAKHGCAVRAGLHCAPLAHESAGTLEWGTVRLSPSVFTTEEEMRRAARLIRQISLQNPVK